jgi:hypothetical protein
VDELEHRHEGPSAGLRSLPVHLPQPDALDAGRHPGAGDHDEPEPRRPRDREAASHDYTVNLRAELEIMHLHDKIDTMREKQMFEMLKQQREAIRLLKGQVERLSVKKA